MDDGDCGDWIWGGWWMTVTVLVGLVVVGFAMVSGGGYECGGWVCALQWLVVVGLCLHFQMFRIHQTLLNT